ncbi:hypothetical protein ACJZ2D_007790 [Fusarium nematophilum]
MVSERHTRAQARRAAIRTDLSQSLTDESLDETGSAPVAPRREHSGDHSSSSKFAEAMSNPNWRRRRGENSGSHESAVPGATTCEAQDSQPHGSSKAFRAEESPKNHGICKKTCPWDHIDAANHWKSSHSSSDIDTSDKDVTTVDELCAHLSDMDIRSASPSGKNPPTGGFCTLVDQMELPGLQSKGRPVSIVQLIPFAAGDRLQDGWVGMRAGPISPLAHIQRIHRADRRVREMGEQSEPKPERDAPLETGVETPAGFRNRPSGYEHRDKNEIMIQSLERRLEKARNAVLHDPAVANVGTVRCEPPPKPGEREEMGSPTKSSKKSKEIAKRHAEFQKILRKLQRGAEQRAKTAKDISGDSFEFGHSCPWGLHHEQQVSRMKERRPVNSSDSGIGSLYTETSRRKENSQDSGICIDPDSLSKGLNPRAREFLSFRGKIPITAEDGDLQVSSGSLDQCHKGGDINAGNSAVTNPALFGKPFPILPADHGPGKMSAISPEGFSEGFGTIPNSNLDASGLGYLSGLPQFTGITFPMVPQAPSALGTPDLIPQVNLGTSVGACPPPAGLSNQFNLTAINSVTQTCPSVSTPFLGNLPALPMPCPPLPAMGGVHPQPRPVAKPIDPHPVQQLRYEAWIEWRKANEPGYAMECKARQQRRAQRNMVAKLKFETQNVKQVVPAA